MFQANDASVLKGLQEAKALIKDDNGNPPSDRPFPDRVKALRARLNLTQDQFAEMYGLPAATIKNWEQGRRKSVGAAAEVLIKMIENDPEGMAEKVLAV
ncbi:helix-turn-helix domain-containing protein [Tropicibacter sp. R15_0]|uniref:helix-turn-helix domain-containing protein n=1 Tax=Tropicibacter sp. R15_0 TaxID=2821101 RepID=UPI001AD99C2C|nr:helix-turn-helix domain-containing protein [Tropicibacter sp. R15_0]MBO9468056.1 helix-turn-helix domain-containing protein [Tropicibacter sp. R15_0]